jgi:hypothetical protein
MQIKTILKFVFPVVAAYLLTACPSEPLPIVSGAIGTYNYQITPNQPETQIGTAITLKLRLSSNRTTAPASISVTGPSGWNNNQSLNFIYPTGSDWVLSPEQDIPAIAGEYSITTSIISNNQTVKNTIKLTLTDATTVLPLTTISLSEITRNSVTGTWTLVENAQGYFSRIINATDAVSITNPIYSITPNAVFPLVNQSLDLNPSKTNVFVVNSTNFDTVITDPVLPSQINYSDSAAFIPVPNITPSSTRTNTRATPTLFVKP